MVFFVWSSSLQPRIEIDETVVLGFKRQCEGSSLKVRLKFDKAHYLHPLYPLIYSQPLSPSLSCTPTTSVSLEFQLSATLAAKRVSY